jgi:threonine-phosphate decarboxylase
VNDDGYRHGGHVWEEALDLGMPPAEILDFSANMNPFGPPATVVSCLREAIDDLRHYPDPSNHGLVRAISEFQGIDGASIVPANGGAEAIFALPPALEISSGVCCAPTFTGYAESLEAWKKPVVSVPHRFGPGEGRFRRAIEEATRKAAPGSAVYICNPNNPTGEIIEREFLTWAWRRITGAGAVLVVDEAFMDFVTLPHEQVSMLKDAAQCPRLVVLRSMTKFYSIAGLRLGYCVTVPPDAERIQRLLPPWSVNRLAQVAGVAALEDTEFVKTAARVALVREKLSADLGATRLFRVFPSVANYLLLEILADAWDGPRLARETRKRGILIRDCSNISGLDRSFVRVAVRLPHENERLVALTRQIIGGRDDDVE